MPSPPVFLRSSALSCALGLDLAESLSALKAGRLNAQPIELTGLAEPVQMPYYRIPDGTDLFDPERLERWTLKVAAAALEPAALSAAELAKLPVFLGSSSFAITAAEAAYLEALETKSGHALALPIIGYDQVADILAEGLGVKGERFAFNTACTASANALLYAARMISLGRFPHALVLGVELANRTTLAGFSGLQLVADVLRPFDLKRSGIVLGEGVGAVLLSREAASGALRLRGGAATFDAYSVTTTDPNGSQVSALVDEALQKTGLTTANVRAIKGHGTGSPLNDLGEATGLRQSFASQALPPLCALKPYLGHTLGACGVNEAALFGAALQAGFLPATPNFSEMDPALGVEPLSKLAPAPDGSYLLNYFGFGGSNTALLLDKGAA